MQRDIALVTLVVADYDEALAYYVGKLGFECVEDTPLLSGKRWVVVRPPQSHGSGLLLGKAVGEVQEAAIGAQSGGRVFLFLHTDDIARDFAALSVNGVRFLEEPRAETYGMVAVFVDLYGNRWDLLQPAV